jgi:hypothetical protein
MQVAPTRLVERLPSPVATLEQAVNLPPTMPNTTNTMHVMLAVVVAPMLSAPTPTIVLESTTLIVNSPLVPLVQPWTNSDSDDTFYFQSYELTSVSSPLSEH